MSGVLFFGLWMSGSAELDGQPWPVYLSEDGLRASIEAQALQWPECEASSAPWTARAQLVLGSQGSVLSVEGGEGLSDCWRERLGALEVGDHPEEGLRIQLSIYISEGRLQKILALERQEQASILPFLHLPRGLSLAQEERIREALSLASGRSEE